MRPHLLELHLGMFIADGARLALGHSYSANRAPAAHEERGRGHDRYNYCYAQKMLHD